LPSDADTCRGGLHNVNMSSVGGLVAHPGSRLLRGQPSYAGEAVSEALVRRKSTPLGIKVRPGRCRAPFATRFVKQCARRSWAGPSHRGVFAEIPWRTPSCTFRASQLRPSRAGRSPLRVSRRHYMTPSFRRRRPLRLVLERPGAGAHPRQDKPADAARSETWEAVSLGSVFPS
jgi:hypothetical protein